MALKFLFLLLHILFQDKIILGLKVFCYLHRLDLQDINVNTVVLHDQLIHVSETDLWKKDELGLFGGNCEPNSKIGLMFIVGTIHNMAYVCSLHNLGNSNDASV